MKESRPELYDGLCRPSRSTRSPSQSLTRLRVNMARRMTGCTAAKKLGVRESGIDGLGCFALRRLPARKKIALFAGELIIGRGRIEARLRGQDVVKLIRLGEDSAIDGAAGGGETAYINHSCEPNAFMRAVPGRKVAFFALRDIAPGEEITINYRDPDHPSACRCGASRCRSGKASASSHGNDNETSRGAA